MIFEADPDHIATLDSTSLVLLLKRILLAEARSAGIALRTASVPLQITVADGGEDGRIEWEGGAKSTGYLPSRINLFQSKAQNLNPSQITAEVLKASTKCQPKLNDTLQEVIDRGGAYVIFCRERMVNSKRAKLVKAVKAAIKSAGEDPAKAAAIEVYDANLIADWVNNHPAVALWLASKRMGRNLAGFQTHEGWGRSPDFSPPWKVTSNPRFTPENRVIAAADRQDPARPAWTYDQAAAGIMDFLSVEKAIVRICGPSGFGKSRFAYEVFARETSIADEIDKGAVVFCDGSVSGDEVVRLSLELADAAATAILVVDECSDELHNKLANNVMRTDSRLRLVTINIETRVVLASNTLTVRLEKADDELIANIAKGIAPDLTDKNTRFVAELAEGFPRMAVLGAQQDAGSRQTLESVEQVIERIIWNGKPRSTEAQRVLEIAALFEWVGIEGAPRTQAEFLARELAQIGPDLLIEHLLSFQSRGIITRRGDFLQVGPVPLAARLALKRLGVMTVDQLVHIFENAPEELKSTLLRRIKWLDTSPIAVEFARRLLGPSMFGNFAALNTAAGSKVMDRLVQVAPDDTSDAIERIFGSLSLDELRAAREGRRYLVWALEKLAFRKRTFTSSARLLLRLAAAENEDFANNATGIFKQLFQLYLSGTEAQPADRIRVLDEGLTSSDEATRCICVDALGRMMDASHFSRAGGSEQIGTSEALDDWAPRTYGEQQDFFRAAISRLIAIATSVDPLANLAKSTLGRHVRGLLSQLPAAEVKTMIDAVTQCSGFWPEALTGISDWLYFDRSKEVPQNIQIEIRKLYDVLLPTDPVELAILYTNGWQTDLHDPDSNFEHDSRVKLDFEYAQRQAVKVAQAIAQNADLTNRALEKIACGDGKSAFPFARALVKSASEPFAIMSKSIAIADSSSKQPNIGFFAGLICGSDELDKEISRKFLTAALQSPKLKTEAIALIGAVTLQSDEMNMVIELLKGGDIKPLQCRNLGLSRLDETTLIPLLAALEEFGTDGLWAIIDIVGMYCYSGGVFTRELIALIKRVIVTPELMDAVSNSMDGYHLEQMIESLLKRGAVGKGYARSLAKQVLRICRKGTDRLFYQLDGSVRKILGHLIEVQPIVTWDEIAKQLRHNSWEVRYYTERLLAGAHRDDHLGRGLSINVPRNIYLEWVREKPEARAADAVDWLPIADKDAVGALVWHPELLEFVNEFAEQPRVLIQLSRRLRPSSYWGGLAPYLAPLIPLIEGWSEHPNAAIRSWAASETSRLKKEIANENKRSEEDIVELD